MMQQQFLPGLPSQLTAWLLTFSAAGIEGDAANRHQFPSSAHSLHFIKKVPNLTELWSKNVISCWRKAKAENGFVSKIYHKPQDRFYWNFQEIINRCTSSIGASQFKIAATNTNPPTIKSLSQFYTKWAKVWCGNSSNAKLNSKQSNSLTSVFG